MACIITYKNNKYSQQEFEKYFKNNFNEFVNEFLSQDIEGFKDWVDGRNTFDKDLAQKIQDKLEKLYPEIKLDISNNPVWEQGYDIFNQEIIDIQEDLEGLELFTDVKDMIFYSICNDTAKECFLHLRDKGLNPFPISANGSTISFTTGAPIKGTYTRHYVSVVAINNKLFIYDMPQNQYLSGEHITDKDIELSRKLIRAYGSSEGTGAMSVKVTKPFTPFLIPLDLSELKAQYNMDDLMAAKAIKSVLQTGSYDKDREILLPDYKTKVKSISMETYIKNNIENGENYITELKNQYESIIENAENLKILQKEQEKINTLKEAENFINKELSEKDNIKVKNFINHKIKLKSRNYLPRTSKEFNYNLIAKNILGKLQYNVVEFTPSEYLKKLDIYLQSDEFIVDLFNKYKEADKNVYSKINEIEQLKNRKKEFNAFIGKVAEVGLQNALKSLPSDSFLHNISKLEKAKSISPKQDAAILISKYKDTKKFLKLLEADKNTYDLLQELYQNISIREKYSTLLNYLNVNNRDTSALYAYIQNEIIRQYKYFSKENNIAFQKDEFGKIIGQANIKAMTVLVDAVNKKADTIPHEYAHHYIAWFRDTPIVQEAIKKWGSEEALVQSIGEQVVKQKGEAYNWWKKFTNWILNLLSDKQLLQILTDSFLNRQDLHDFTYNQPNTQQKQQAQQLYSQYLEQTGKQDIEGFKEFVGNKSSQVENIEAQAVKWNYKKAGKNLAVGDVVEVVYSESTKPEYPYFLNFMVDGVPNINNEEKSLKLALKGLTPEEKISFCNHFGITMTEENGMKC